MNLHVQGILVNDELLLPILKAFAQSSRSLHVTRCGDVFNTDMRFLTKGIRPEKCVVRRFRRCANVYLHKTR